MDTPRILLLCIMVAALSMLPLGALADPPAAAVRLTGPTEVHVAANEVEPVAIHVSGRITCTDRLEPPADLIVVPAAHDSVERTIDIVPAALHVPWTPVDDEAGAYRIDSWVVFNVSADAPGLDAPVEAPIVLTVLQPTGEDASPRCDVEGYTVEVQPHAMALQVQPETSTGRAAEPVDDAPQVRVGPILLAVSILTGLAAFAGWRERQRLQR